MMKILLALALLVVASMASPAWAVQNFNPADLSGLSQDMVDTMLRTAALGTSFHAYRPASSLGILGFEVGVEVTAVSIPDEFKQAIALASATPADQVPGIVPVPSVAIHKGLPFGFDIGFSYFQYQSVAKVVGGDLQYSFGKNLPVSLAGRVTLNYGKLYYLNTHSYNFDVLASKDLFLIEPYVGAGLQMWNGDLLYPANINGFAVNVTGHSSSTNPHIFVGLPLKLVFLKLTAEYDHSFSGVSTYGGRLSLGF